MDGSQVRHPPDDFPEDLDKANFETTQAYVKENAHQKLLASLTDVKSYNLTYDIIIAGDSILSYQNKVFEKPKSEQEAKQRLALLSGQVCQFYTCVYLAVLKDGEYKIDEILVGTDIHMAELSEEVIDAYVATGEPFGKALGFGIGAEEMGGTFVSKIDGCYYNTWGFPLPAFAKKLRDLLKDLEMI
eukprot:CAMPEP_0115029412 /NCGR_PEP_ID=MMETSP0216-20121206/36986_1 /TAXON_ID=223996 /ORGANISM="Protocruzia adherens, Strain Boccale" /LENGTH=186 /DNA_ID=CAMNT_0002405993 /DNA_START=99 /DNA_END=660 /DNA_ORIENTATION=-